VHKLFSPVFCQHGAVSLPGYNWFDMQVQACNARESEAQEQLHSCNANLAQVKRDKDDMSNSLKEKCSQLVELQRESADKKRALDAECEKLSREKHKRQRIEEDNQVSIVAQPVQ
jgi:chromosome segregation ATPase